VRLVSEAFASGFFASKNGVKNGVERVKCHEIHMKCPARAYLMLRMFGKHLFVGQGSFECWFLWIEIIKVWCLV
jgi:hypothetical protein